MRLSQFLFAGVTGNIWDRPILTEPLNLTSDSQPVIVCDAGSTGSRCFGYYIRDSTVHTELLGRTMVGISSFADGKDFEGAMESLLPSVLNGISRFGEHTKTYILATGGVRQLALHQQQELMSGVLEGLTKHIDGKIHVKVMHGMEEALFGLFATNYLVGGLRLHQVSDKLSHPIGVLDLGGSSLEISLAGPDATMGSHDDLLYSFTDLGTNRVKALLEERGQLQYCDFDNVCLSILFLSTNLIRRTANGAPML